MTSSQAEPSKADPQVPPADETSRSEVQPTGKSKRENLLPWTGAGIALTAVVSFGVLTFFVRLIDGQGSWWKIWSHQLTDGKWFEAARVTVALVALTVAGGAAYLAYRRQRTADENQKTAAETQLTTAKAYKLSTNQHASTLRRELRTRFTDAAAQLAHSSAAVRIAGVYAIAALADDWHSRNEANEVQTCIDVLCGYLRLPYDPEHAVSHQTKRVITRPRVDSDGAVSGEIEEHFEFRQNDREVRKTIVRVIRDHLVEAASPSWSDRAYDFQGAVLEDVVLSRTSFRGPVSFAGAKFHGKSTSFDRAKFYSESTSFVLAQFHSKTTSFDLAQFHSKTTRFARAEFHSKTTSFVEAEFHSGMTSFNRPRVWQRVYFDWDPRPPLAVTGSKPDSVLPVIWPPVALGVLPE
ncbi:pentapeptide repeat-containing protein [Rhodococcus globerulus]|uniref:pentapeptide repeat-containing protein n=1 Tax=Rhodococcus globerulus TaxID=33008 RepID=UPI001F183139|nr:pentapeptide repeat-containing protein [Rhodococcus globerulus]MCE4265290.1 hypothetical protein [Rhodococcus globerulus]